MILADNGSPWYVSGAPNPDWDDDDLHTLGRITGADFEVVDTSDLVNSPLNPPVGGVAARRRHRYQLWVSGVVRAGVFPWRTAIRQLPSQPTRAHYQRLLWRAGFSGSKAQIDHYVRKGLAAPCRSC